jgi:hypothetical protein
VKVTGHATVKGRGTVTLIDTLPAELEVDSYVSSGTPHHGSSEEMHGVQRIWKVGAIETHAMPRSHTNGKPAGLLLQGNRGAPAVGEVLVIVVRGKGPRFGDEAPGVVKDPVFPDMDGSAGDCT